MDNNNNNQNKGIAGQGQSFTSQNEYLQALEELLRLNRPTRTVQLYDTGSLTPNQLVETAGVRPETITGAAPINTGVTMNEYMRPVYNYPQYTTPTMDQGVEQPMTYQEFAGQRPPQGATETTEKFLEDMARTFYSPNVQQEAKTAAQTVYPKVTMNNGAVIYSDGTTAYPVQTMNNGAIFYSDGNVNYPIGTNADGSIRYAGLPPKQSTQNVQQGEFTPFTTQEGVAINSFDDYLGLISRGRLGSKNITGGFGAKYGFARENVNIGTDIGTGRLGENQVDLYLPFGAKVVGMSEWDGLPPERTNTMYGNSVTVQLPSGHTIRFSHLSQLPSLSAGQQIQAGTYLGTTGDTGHAFGKHLDHEMRDAGGQLISSENFFNTVAQNPDIAKTLVKPVEVQPTEETQAAQPQTMPTKEEPLMSMATPEEMKQVTPAKSQSIGQIGQTFSQSIEQKRPTGGFDIGVSEALRGDIAGGAQIAGQTIGRGIEKVGQALPSNIRQASEFGVSEALRQGSFDPILQAAQKRQPLQAELVGRAVQGLGGLVSQAGQKFGLGEMGISEALQRGARLLTGEVEAAEPQVMGAQTSQQEASKMAEMAQQPGAGVERLRTEERPELENIFKKASTQDIGQKRAVGEETATGGDIGALSGLARQTERGNAQDVFFKAGGAEGFKEFLKPGITAQYRGALTPDLFKETFFENPDNIANVFGSTPFAKEATEKYKQYMAKQYPILPGGESPTVKKVATGRYDDGEQWSVEYEDVNPTFYENEWRRSILSSIPSVLSSDFKFQAPRSSAVRMAGARQGLIEGQQGMLKNIGNEKVGGASATLQQAPKNIFQSITSAITSKFAPPVSKGFTIPTKPTPQPQQSTSQPGRSTQSYSTPANQGVSTPARTTVSAPTRTTVSTPTKSTAPAKATTPAPKPTPKPTPAPAKPAPKPAPPPSRPAPAKSVAPSKSSTPAPKPTPKPTPAKRK